MDPEPRRTIKISFEDDVHNVLVYNNSLKKSFLAEYYPEGSKLTYKINGEKFLLEADDCQIYLNSNVNEYLVEAPRDNFRTQKNSDGRKLMNFEVMCAKLRQDKDAKVKDKKRKLPDQKIDNSKQKSENVNKKPKFTKRVVTLQWKHRNNFDGNYEFMGSTIGKKKIITLNGCQNYSVEELTKIFYKEYVNENNIFYFDNSFIAIGMSDGTVIQEFKNDAGEEMSFWDYSNQKLRNSSHVLHIYLLTTNVNKPVSKMRFRNTKQVDDSLEDISLNSSFDSNSRSHLNVTSPIREKDDLGLKMLKPTVSTAIASNNEIFESNVSSLFSSQLSYFKDTSLPGEKHDWREVYGLSSINEASALNNVISTNDNNDSVTSQILKSKITSLSSGKEHFSRKEVSGSSNIRAAATNNKISSSGRNDFVTSEIPISKNIPLSSGEVHVLRKEVSGSLNIKAAATNNKVSTSGRTDSVISQIPNSKIISLSSGKEHASIKEVSGSLNIKAAATNNKVSTSGRTDSVISQIPNSKITSLSNGKENISRKEVSGSLNLKVSAPSSVISINSTNDFVTSRILESTVISPPESIDDTRKEKVLPSCSGTPNKNSEISKSTDSWFSEESEIPSPKYSNLTKHDVSIDDFDFKIPEVKPVMTTKVENLKLSVNMIDHKKLNFISEILGQGAQGVVRKGKYLGSEVAIKSMLNLKTKNKHILREINLLYNIRHLNIILIMGVSSSPSEFHIVMEFFKSSSLFHLLFRSSNDKKELSMNSKIFIALQLCRAVAYLHMQPHPIIHRDIKPDNILVNQYFQVKLCDLGLGHCKMLEDTLQSTKVGNLCGTLIYMAPEVVLNNAEANVETDTWSLGCTLLELFNEKHVWTVRNLTSLMQIFVKKEKPHIQSVPEFLQFDLGKCFEYAGKNRPKIIDIVNLLENQ